jgi:hypothetical protein
MSFTFWQLLDNLLEWQQAVGQSSQHGRAGLQHHVLQAVCVGDGAAHRHNVDTAILQ